MDCKCKTWEVTITQINFVTWHFICGKYSKCQVKMIRGVWSKYKSLHCLHHKRKLTDQMTQFSCTLSWHGCTFEWQARKHYQQTSSPYLHTFVFTLTWRICILTKAFILTHAFIIQIAYNFFENKLVSSFVLSCAFHLQNCIAHLQAYRETYTLTVTSHLHMQLYMLTYNRKFSQCMILCNCQVSFPIYPLALHIHKWKFHNSSHYAIVISHFEYPLHAWNTNILLA